MEPPQFISKPTSLSTPILFLVFNRPKTTLRVLEEIRRAKPRQLYVASDGPRNRNSEDLKSISEVRKIIDTQIDWPCEVKTLFRTENLGCKDAISSAINWFFEFEEMGIILEDDCVPNSDFFIFCEYLLVKHKEDKSVAGITGNFHQLYSNELSDKYSRIPYPLIWGWATWRRVWKLYDPSITDFSGDMSKLQRLINKKDSTRNYFLQQFEQVKHNKLDTWDYQFTYLMLRHSLDFLHPHQNLITNIGFGIKASHTSFFLNYFSNLPKGNLKFPLTETVNNSYEKWLDKYLFFKTSVFNKLIIRIIQLLRLIIFSHIAK